MKSIGMKDAMVRWGKFNLVGAMGMVVQLGSLALLNRWWSGHYLMASAVALELTLLHNFVWHMRYTWGDRREGASWWRQCVLFHLSNGLVSMVGNLVLMRLLVQGAHVPVVVANVIAIVCCSMVNFGLGHRWAFAAKPLRAASVCGVMAIVLVASSVAAQEPETALPEAPSAQTAPVKPAPSVYHPKASDSYLYNVGGFCGAGASTSSVGTVPTLGCGVGGTFVPLPVFVEFGVMAPQANRSYVTGYVSVDGSIPLAKPTMTYLPMVIVGYSRLFETGHSLDYGLALAMPRFGKPKYPSSSMRVELRDYWTFANPSQHNVMLRVGWMGVEAD